MFHDSKLVEPDLSKPSVRGLAWLLRHPERWPWTFGPFDYNHCPSCAMGLARAMWPEDILHPVPYAVAFALGLSTDKAFMLFHARKWEQGLSPEAIAADLDALA